VLVRKVTDGLDGERRAVLEGPPEAFHDPNRHTRIGLALAVAVLLELGAIAALGFNTGTGLTTTGLGFTSNPFLANGNGLNGSIGLNNNFGINSLNGTTATFGLWSVSSAWAHSSDGALTFSVENFTEEMVDVGSEGHGPGDQMLFTAQLHDAHDHEAQHADDPAAEGVGKVAGQCVLISHSLVQCVATLDLAGGQITVQDLMELPEHHAEGVRAAHEDDTASEEVIAITGGSGDYQDAGGEMHLIEEGDTATIVLHLT